MLYEVITLVFDYIDIDEFIRNKQSQQIQESTEYLEKIGEPRKTGGFNSLRLAEDLASLGFNLVENLSPSDIERRYLKRCTDIRITSYNVCYTKLLRSYIWTVQFINF